MNTLPPSSHPPLPAGAAAARGDAVETLVAAYLGARGLRLVTRNFRGRGGEIDLVMRDGRDLVFVEVRYRRNVRFGSAAESVTAAKRSRIAQTAQQFLQECRLDSPCRFDVVAVSGMAGEQIAWIKDAFRLSD
jgi:putative endonuclease